MPETYEVNNLTFIMFIFALVLGLITILYVSHFFSYQIDFAAVPYLSELRANCSAKENGADYSLRFYKIHKLVSGV